MGVHKKSWVKGARLSDFTLRAAAIIHKTTTMSQLISLLSDKLWYSIYLDGLQGASYQWKNGRSYQEDQSLRSEEQKNRKDGHDRAISF